MSFRTSPTPRAGSSVSSSLEFAVCHYYGPASITVPVTISSGNRMADFDAIVDTGASSCIFERTHAEILGLDVESGRLEYFRTATGRFGAYEHHVLLRTAGLEFHAPVYFAADPAFTRSFVGRKGWLDRIRLAIVHY